MTLHTTTPKERSIEERIIISSAHNSDTLTIIRSLEEITPILTYTYKKDNRVHDEIIISDKKLDNKSKLYVLK